VLEGTPFSPRNTRDAIARGVLLAPEDRKRHGLVLPMTIAQNTSLPNISSYARFGWLDRATEKRVAEAEIKRLRTKTFGISQKVVNLSGGNQQKVVLGKWLLTNPKILFLDEPTRGIDVGAKQEIYGEINKLAEQGMAIVLVSSELPEVLGLSDRVMVLHEGKVTGEFVRGDATPEKVMSAATGNS